MLFVLYCLLMPGSGKLCESSEIRDRSLDEKLEFNRTQAVLTRKKV